MQQTQASGISGNTITVSLPPRSITELLTRGTPLYVRPDSPAARRPAGASGAVPGRVLYSLDGRRVGTMASVKRGNSSVHAVGLFVIRDETQGRPMLILSGRQRFAGQ